MTDEVVALSYCCMKSFVPFVRPEFDSRQVHQASMFVLDDNEDSPLVTGNKMLAWWACHGFDCGDA